MTNFTEKQIMKNWVGTFNKPLLSICVISYNQEEYIEDALDSFLMQKTEFPFEIVIDDDASDDGTAIIISRYKSRFPNIIKSNSRKKNIGSRRNFIENIKRATGKYIAFCDGDDYWIDPFKLQKQVDFLERNEDFSICASRYEVHPTRKISNFKGEYTHSDLLKKNILGTLTVVFRSRLINSKMFEILDNKPVCDWIMWLYLSKYGKIKILEDISAVYRVHDKGIFSSLSWFGQLKIELDFYKSIYSDNFFTDRDRDIMRISAKRRILIILNDLHDIIDSQKIDILDKYDFFLSSVSIFLARVFLKSNRQFYLKVISILLRIEFFIHKISHRFQI